MRRIGIVTGARSDWGIFLPVARAIRDADELELRVIATGMHLSVGHGLTVAEIEADGFVVDERVETLLDDDTPAGIAGSLGAGVAKLAPAIARQELDLLLLLGDRYEMLAAGLAALPFALPVAHIHGGELTEGLIDDPIRHSLTKLSHLHFASTETYARRIRQLGEEGWRVTVSGAPSLDKLGWPELALPQGELERRLGLSLAEATVLVTYHPVTLEHVQVARRIDALLAALDPLAAQIVFTSPNADTNRSIVRERMQQFVDRHARARLVENLGSAAYFSLLRHAAAMVGNSSSGLIEAASFELPVVNVGSRQGGRVRPGNVIDVDDETASIASGISRALDPAFRLSLRGLENPYGDGQAARRIVERLLSVRLGPELIVKRFVDLPAAGE